MRLIDADRLAEKLAERAIEALSYDECEVETIKGDMHIVNSSPTIDPVHAAGGCYCKECVKFSRYTQARDFGICKHYTFEVGENDFCSYGERREQNETD